MATLAPATPLTRAGDLRMRPPALRLDRSAQRLMALALAGLGAVVAVEPYLVAETWHWTFGRGVLGVAPGALAVAAGAALVAGGRRGPIVGGLLALAAALWLIAAPLVSLTWPDGALGLAAEHGATLRTTQWLAFFLGIGAMVAALGAYALGLLELTARRPVPPGRARNGVPCAARHRAGPAPLARRRDRLHAGARIRSRRGG